MNLSTEMYTSIELHGHTPLGIKDTKDAGPDNSTNAHSQRVDELQKQVENKDKQFEALKQRTKEFVEDMKYQLILEKEKTNEAQQEILKYQLQLQQLTEAKKMDVLQQQDHMPRDMRDRLDDVMKREEVYKNRTKEVVDNLKKKLQQEVSKSEMLQQQLDSLKKIKSNRGENQSTSSQSIETESNDRIINQLQPLGVADTKFINKTDVIQVIQGMVSNIQQRCPDQENQIIQLQKDLKDPKIDRAEKIHEENKHENREIVEEFKSQLHERDKKEKQYKKEIEELKMKLNASIETSSKLVEDMKEEQKKASEDKAKLYVPVKQLDQSIRQQESKCKTLEEELLQYKSKIQHLETELNRIKVDLYTSKEKEKKLMTEMKAYQDDYNLLEQSTAQNNNQLKELKQEKSTIQTELLSSKGSYAKLRDQYKDMEKLYQETNEKLRTLLIEHDKLIQIKFSIEDERLENKNKITKLEKQSLKQVQESENKKNELEKEVQLLNEKINVLQNRLEETEKSKQNELNSLQEFIHIEKEKRKNLQDELANFKKDKEKEANSFYKEEYDRMLLENQQNTIELEDHKMKRLAAKSETQKLAKQLEDYKQSFSSLMHEIVIEYKKIDINITGMRNKIGNTMLNLEDSLETNADDSKILEIEFEIDFQSTPSMLVKKAHQTLHELSAKLQVLTKQVDSLCTEVSNLHHLSFRDVLIKQIGNVFSNCLSHRKPYATIGERKRLTKSNSMDSDNSDNA